MQLRLMKIDRISDLPEHLIIRILSCLPTKDAVRTSTLSRDWRYKWIFIYDINPNLTLPAFTPKKTMIFQGLDRFMNLSTEDSWTIRTFCLSCYYFSSGVAQAWITGLFRRNIENLEIIVNSSPADSPLQQGCFTGWTSLTKLKLWVRCTLGVSAINCFPNLKSLCLMEGVRIKNEEESVHTRRVALIFPVLDVLELEYCRWIDVDYVEIQAPKLITCTLTNQEETTLILKAPAVTNASLDHPHPLSDTFVSWASKMLQGFPNLKCLKLPGKLLVHTQLVLYFSWC